MGRAVSAEIAHIGVDVGQSDGADELDVHIIDGDRFHGRILGDKPFFQLEIAEKAAQIQKVFVHGFSGVRLDRFMVRKKVAQDRRRFGTVIVHELSQKQLSFKAGDPDRPKDIIEQNKNFVQKRVALKRFLAVFAFLLSVRINCLKALSILKIQKTV